MSVLPDKGSWYQIFTKAGLGQASNNNSWVLDNGLLDMGSNGYGKPSFQPNTSDNTASQWWQFWPVNDTYLIRAAGAGPNVFLSAYGEQTTYFDVSMKSPERYANDKSMLWKISATGSNGYYSMTNMANGTAFELASAKGANYGAFFAPSGSPDPAGQGLMSFSSVASANWFGYQTLQTPAVAGGSTTATASTMATASSTGSAAAATASQDSGTDSAASNSALSPGAAAGIATAVTLVVCSLVFGGTIFWLQRKNRRQRANNSMNTEFTQLDRGSKQGLMQNNIELQRPSNQPAELDHQRGNYAEELDNTSLRH